MVFALPCVTCDCNRRNFGCGDLMKKINVEELKEFIGTCSPKECKSVVKKLVKEKLKGSK